MYWGFLNDVKLFLICIYLRFFAPRSVKEGEMWDHYTVTVYVWCATSVKGRIFNWSEPSWGVFLNYNSLLQSDKHAAGAFTCKTERANDHLALTVAFHEPMMSAFNCILSVHLLSHTLILPILHTHAWINKVSLSGIQQIWVWAEVPMKWGRLVLFWLLELSNRE